MEVKNLSVGLVVKNYKQMCQLLGCSVCSGNSKISQMKIWNSYFRYERSGQKFIITEIYENPLAVKDLRKVRDGIYTKYIELILLDCLLKNKNQIRIVTSKLYQMLGMVNEEYIKLRDIHTHYKTRGKIVKSLSVSNFDVESFQKRVELKFSNILHSALDSMTKRGLIEYHTEYFVCNPLSKRVALANENQIEEIRSSQKKALDEIKCKDIKEAILKHKMIRFKRLVNKDLVENYNLTGCFSRLSISYISDAENQLRLRADDIKELNIEELKKQLNKKVINFLNRQIQRNYEKSKQDAFDYILDDANENKKFFEYSDRYVDAQIELVDYLINISKNTDYKNKL